MIPIETTCLVFEAPRAAKACARSVRREIRVMPVGRVNGPGLFTRDFSTTPPRPASAPSANAGHFYPRQFYSTGGLSTSDGVVERDHTGVAGMQNDECRMKEVQEAHSRL